MFFNKSAEDIITINIFLRTQICTKLKIVKLNNNVI